MFLTEPVNLYKVESSFFRSKVEAFLYAQRAKKPVEWIFSYEKTFNNYDWSTEPELTLDQLYDNRAKFLREKYDYIMLLYSGGADSHNMLMSFYRQNLLVDEIVNVHVTAASEKFNTHSTDSYNINAEHVYNTIPKMNWISTHMPKTKITSLDMSDNTFNFLGSDESWVVERSNEFFGLYSAKFDLLVSKDIRNTLNSNKKVGIILGADKPKTFIRQGFFYTGFSDITFSSSNPFDINLDMFNYNASIEYFYWSKDATDLLCKQAHVIKKYIEAFPARRNFWDVELNYNFITRRMYHETWLRPVIYTTWDNGFQVEKSISTFPSEWDTWWFNVADEKQISLYKSGLNYIFNNASQFLRFRDNKPDGLKIFTKDYVIGKMK